MTEETRAQDELNRAYSLLRSIRTNLPDDMYVGERFVKEYASALHHLSGLGLDLNEFSIPDGWLERRARSKQPFGSGTVVTYEAERKVLRSLFVTKLDAVLGYFAVGKSKDPIGFRN